MALVWRHGSRTDLSLSVRENVHVIHVVYPDGRGSRVHNIRVRVRSGRGLVLIQLRQVVWVRVLRVGGGGPERRVSCVRVGDRGVERVDVVRHVGREIVVSCFLREYWETVMDTAVLVARRRFLVLKQVGRSKHYIIAQSLLNLNVMILELTENR